MGTPQTVEQRGENRRDGELRRVALIGLLSGALYIVVYLAQRAIFLNGLVLDIGGVVRRGMPQDAGRLRLEAGAYSGATVLLFVLYAWLLRLGRRDALRSSRARTLALAFPILFNLGLLIGRPYLSIDIFSYMAHGYLGTTPGYNPYLNAAREVVDTAGTR